MTISWKTTLLLIAFLAIGGNANDCVPRSFGTDKIVCVCNATYCDDTPDNDPRIPEDGTFYWYVSSKDGRRMSGSQGQFNSCNIWNSGVKLNIDTSQTYQTILGFGGAFTDSVGINLNQLSADTQDQLMRAYFGSTGSRYLLGRVPIGGSDFSTRPYTYDDVANDTLLRNFSLASEDYLYKIPLIKKARELNPDVLIFSAAWSAPPWMKTNNRINGFGFLKPEYYQLYADYILRFIDEYANNGIPIWAVSTGNEPINAYVPFDSLNTMGWTPRSVGTWVAENLGPTLANSRHDKTLILALDDQRLEIPWFVRNMFQVKGAKNYTAGTAVHWYADSIVPAVVLDQTHNDFPDKFILLTEASIVGSGIGYKKVDLGSWDRAEQYIDSIITYINHYSVGWVDWNLALDKEGGPNWISNFVDSPIIVNPETDEFFKNPMYYALKHVSRFVDRGSVRISINNTNIFSNVKSTAFVTPDNQVVSILYNAGMFPSSITLNDPEKGRICLELPGHSISTVIYAL